VGKTTTIAKLAAIERLSRRRTVALLNLDCYRVGSQEELQRLGKWLDVPVGIAYEKQQVRSLLQHYAAVDSLFIDTPGRGWKEPGIREKIFEIMTACPDNRFHLLLSPHFERETLARDIKEYSILPLDSVIMTKVDEACRFGGIFDVLFSHPIPLSWITTGQGVPNDITLVNKGLLFDMLMEG
jgi:flagellar biosynthesis protein FlhF